MSPMYMPGRLRTASRPFKTVMESAPYRQELGFGFDRLGLAQKRSEISLWGDRKITSGSGNFRI